MVNSFDIRSDTFVLKVIVAKYPVSVRNILAEDFGTKLSSCAANFCQSSQLALMCLTGAGWSLSPYVVLSVIEPFVTN